MDGCSRLTVVYVIEDGINKELDSKIKIFFEELGWQWWAQGFTMDTGERDIAFDK